MESTGCYWLHPSVHSTDRRPSPHCLFPDRIPSAIRYDTGTQKRSSNLSVDGLAGLLGGDYESIGRYFSRPRSRVKLPCCRILNLPARCWALNCSRSAIQPQITALRWHFFPPNRHPFRCALSFELSCGSSFFGLAQVRKYTTKYRYLIHH